LVRGGELVLPLIALFVVICLLWICSTMNRPNLLWWNLLTVSNPCVWLPWGDIFLRWIVCGELPVNRFFRYHVVHSIIHFRPKLRIFSGFRSIETFVKMLYFFRKPHSFDLLKSCAKWSEVLVVFWIEPVKNFDFKYFFSELFWGWSSGLFGL
jgi:hypothetical protein